MPTSPTFPIMDTQITYDIQDAEDKDWNQEWEEQGFDPIFVGDQVVIYDAKHPELYPDTSNRPDIIEIGIEAKLAFGTGNHETTRMIIAQLLEMPVKTKRILDCGTGTGILGLTASKLGAKGCGGLRHRRMERGECQAQCRAQWRRQHGGTFRKQQRTEPREWRI